MADVYEAAGVDRMISVDLHTADPGVLDVPLDHLTAMPLLAGHFANVSRRTS